MWNESTLDGCSKNVRTKLGSVQWNMRYCIKRLIVRLWMRYDEVTGLPLEDLIHLAYT